MDSCLAAGAQSSATALSISTNVCSDEHSVCSSNNQIMADVHSGSGPEVNSDAHHGIANICLWSDTVVDDLSKGDGGNEGNMDVQDLSSFETTLEYSISSDIQDGKIADRCEAQTTIEYYTESTTDPITDVEKNAVADVMTDMAVTNDLQRPIVNVDLRNSPVVRSPPTLMVV